MNRFVCLYFYTVGLLISPINGEFYSRCYNVSNYQHCLSTDENKWTWQEAKAACRANNSVLISVTTSDIRSVLEQFRLYVSSLFPDIDNNAVWIDVSTDSSDDFHWTTGDRGTSSVDNEDDAMMNRFGAIAINNNQAVFYAQTWDTPSFYVCQNTGAGNCDDGFQRNSVCYKKYNNEPVTWFTASNRCLSMSGSLATFNDLTTPRDDSSLTTWLNITGTTKYWIGLVRRWFVTTDRDGSVVDVQYTNWNPGNPYRQPDNVTRRCVALRSHGSTWIDTERCTDKNCFICQAISQLSSTMATTRTTPMPLPSEKPPPSLTSSSANGGSPDGRSSTTIPLNNEQTSDISSHQQQQSTSSVGSPIALGVGIGVGVGIPVIIAIIVVNILIKCRQNRSESDSMKHQITQHNVTVKELKPVAPEQIYTSLSVTSPDAAHHLYSQLQEATPSDPNTPVTSSQVYASLDVEPLEDAGHVYAHLRAPGAENC